MDVLFVLEWTGLMVLIGAIGIGAWRIKRGPRAKDDDDDDDDRTPW